MPQEIKFVSGTLERGNDCLLALRVPTCKFWPPSVDYQVSVLLLYLSPLLFSFHIFTAALKMTLGIEPSEPLRSTAT